MKSLTFAIAIAASATAFAAGPADSLAVAKELYATAAYEEALATLTDARKSAPPSSAEAIQLDQYRVFCLYALGRRADAESVAQAIVRVDPFFQSADDEASPAIAALFARVRKQTLPVVIREKYRAARVAMDRKDFVAAEPLLVDVQRLIAQSSTLDVSDDAIADIGVLAEGFLVLGRTAVTERPDSRNQSVPPVDAPTPGPLPIDARLTGGVVTYGPDSPGVTPPVAIVQGLPPVPVQLARVTEKRGLLEVTIEPTGRVGAVVVRQSMSPGYDRLVVEAAKRWQYKPATKDGVPVRFVKAVFVEVKPG